MSRATSFLVDAAATAGSLALALQLKRSPPLILMYHGVSSGALPDSLGNCEGKHIPLDVFARHLRILQRSRRVIALHELVEGLRDRQDMRNTVAITFDDGYENNYLVAAPALADFRMAAAFFLATGLIGTDDFIWTDRLARVLELARGDTTSLSGGGGEMPIHLPGEKRLALLRIKAELKKLPALARNEAIEKLAVRHGVPDERADGDYRFMNWDQVRGLVQAGFEVGAHTITHPILTKVSFEEAAAEIVGSRDKVQQETGRCCSTFCFPNGKASDFSTELQEVCRQHFRAALSTNRGAAALEDIYELKRLSPAGPGQGENVEWMLLRGR